MNIQLEEELSEEFICDSAESGDLFIGQTCGYPLVMQSYDKLNVVAVPMHELDGCPEGPFYRSVLITKVLFYLIIYLFIFFNLIIFSI